MSGPNSRLVVGLDADDTLWESEAYFHEVEHRFAALMEPWIGREECLATLLDQERSTIELYGFGVKSFVLSMIDMALEVSAGTIEHHRMSTILDWGKELLSHPVELLPGVQAAVDELAQRHTLVLITKGDLHHQGAKIAASGIAHRFAATEIIASKDAASYAQVLERHQIGVEEFVMVGNSLRSDVAPILELGARAVHIPHHLTWGFETATSTTAGHSELDSISDLPSLLESWNV